MSMWSTASDDYGMTSMEADQYEGCLHCGAEIDHHLGCPEDPDPDYEAERELADRPRSNDA